MLEGREEGAGGLGVAVGAQVRVHKPGALRFSDSVGVVIERTPADYE